MNGWKRPVASRAKPVVALLILLAFPLIDGAPPGPGTAPPNGHPYDERAAGDRPENPRLFAEGVISTEDDEQMITFTPDGRTAYFMVRSPGTISPTLSVICASRRDRGTWSRPKVAPFSGQYPDMFPRISPDGSRFFFASTRPVDGQPRRDFDLWVMDRTPTGWSDPRHLGAPVNTPVHELSPSVSRDGTLYFARVPPPGQGTPRIFRAAPVPGGYTEPVSLGDSVNGDVGAVEPCIAPDESFLVFSSVGRPDELVSIHRSYNQGDLYISWNKGGHWTRAHTLGATINSGAAESCPSLSADGRTLFFASDRGFATRRPRTRIGYTEIMHRLHSVLNGMGNIYEVPVPPGAWAPRSGPP